MLIGDNAAVLFQGDSITDGDRRRDDLDDLGNGYVSMAAAWFSALYPEKRVRFLNRGISGNRAADLRARWRTDCLDLKPTIVSILIGVNDTWRRYDSNDPTSVEAFEDNYRAILRQTISLGATIVMGQPFLLPIPPDRIHWREDLEPKIDATRKLAEEFKAIYIPYDEIFAKAGGRREPEFWAGDGVHPTSVGHALMAQSWLRACGAL